MTQAVQAQIDHYRQRVAATQSAIVNLCDKALDDKSAIIRLNSLCEFMVKYREQLNYWLALEKEQNKPVPTVEDCKQALDKKFIFYIDIYPVHDAIAQMEKYGTLRFVLNQLHKAGFEATGEQDYMDDLPYSLIQITKLPKAQV